MKLSTMTGIAGCLIAAAAVTTVADVAQAAPAGSGASVVIEQNGVATHRMCGSVETYLTAAGFAPSRKSVDVTLLQVPGGVINTVRIPLTDGAGTLDVGRDLVPLTYKLRVRFQTGSSEHTGNYGSYSADLQIC